MSTLERPHAVDTLLFSGALAGALGVVAGAFGAHFLRDTLEASSHLDTWHTAVLYNLVHAAVIIGACNKDRRIRAAGWLWLVGIVLFSGSLYGLSLGAPKWMGPITPMGGACFIAGWVCFAISQVRGRPDVSP